MSEEWTCTASPFIIDQLLCSSQRNCASETAEQTGSTLGGILATSRL